MGSVVLDASAFINASLFEQAECFTVSEVVAEIKSAHARAVYSVAREAGQLRVTSPSGSSLLLVQKKALEVGSCKKLSNADKAVIALALDLKAKIITDDWTVQNLAAHLGIKYEGVARGVIREKKTFRKKTG